MMKKFTKYAGALLAAAVAAGSLAGCQGSSEPKEAAATQTQDSAAQSGQETQGSQAAGAELSGELEIVTNADEQTFNAVNGVFEKFMEENPGVKISYTTQGSDYEQLMKARMASNDLPDIFATHGWSVARYSEYLRPLNDQPWFGTVEEAFKRNIENADGQIFVLPLNMDQGGLMYNKTLLASKSPKPGTSSWRPASWPRTRAIPACLSPARTAASRPT